MKRKNSELFKLWSEVNPKAREELKPDLGLRNWNDLSVEEKYKIWKYLKFYFFNEDPVKTIDGRYYYEFFGNDNDKIDKRERIINSIWLLN